MQIACNYRGLSSSREAPKPRSPSFATLPSENLDFHEKSYFYPARSTSPSPWIPPRWGPLETMKIEGNPFGGTLGARSRSEAALEGARSVLERPKVTEGGPQAAQGPTLDRSGSIFERFQGVRSAPRIGRAESRSTFAKIDFFRFGDRLLLDLASPEASLGRSGAPFERSLGSLGRSWGAPGSPQGRPWAFLGSLLGACGSFWVTFEPL